MGEFFIFTNDTRKKESKGTLHNRLDKNTNWILYTNIDKYGAGHLYKCLYKIIGLEEWDISDTIYFTCGQWGFYKFENQIIYDLLESKVVHYEKICNYKDCSLCF